MKETWIRIKEFSNYFISDFGIIKNIKEEILIPEKLKGGHLRIGLQKNKKRCHKLVHHLVYENFNNEKIDNDECVHHKDENKENNYVYNLKKMTKSEHQSFHMKGVKRQHSNKTKLKMSNKFKGVNNPFYGKHHFEESKIKNRNSHLGKYCGENHPQSILTEEKVIEIRIDLKDGIY